LGGYAYRVTGCGDYAEYECDYDSAQGDNSGTTNNNNFWIYTCLGKSIVPRSLRRERLST
jgi:hypothetical protein